jgi:hypothetical protein
VILCRSPVDKGKTGYTGSKLIHTGMWIIVWHAKSVSKPVTCISSSEQTQVIHRQWISNIRKIHRHNLFSTTYAHGYPQAVDGTGEVFPACMIIRPAKPSTPLGIMR